MSDNWVELPIIGSEVSSLVFAGTAKDGELRIETVGNPAIFIPTSDLRLSFEPSVSFEVALRALDDLNFDQRVSWPGEHRPKVTVAQVDWWLNHSWNSELARWNDLCSAAAPTYRPPRWFLSSVVRVRMRLA